MARTTRSSSARASAGQTAKAADESAPPGARAPATAQPAEAAGPQFVRVFRKRPGMDENGVIIGEVTGADAGAGVSYNALTEDHLPFRWDGLPRRTADWAEATAARKKKKPRPGAFADGGVLDGKEDAPVAEALAYLCSGSVEGERSRWLEGVQLLLPRVKRGRLEVGDIVCEAEDLRLRVVLEPGKCTCFVTEGDASEQSDVEE